MIKIDLVDIELRLSDISQYQLTMIVRIVFKLRSLVEIKLSCSVQSKLTLHLLCELV